MAANLASEGLATGPFKLIETPVHSKNMMKPYDPYAEAASIMALGHNVIIRGLNSIYKQAPHIGKDDAADFVAYATCWHEVLKAHHDMEEDILFPEVEKKTGVEGIMDVNVQQHHAFESGLNAFKSCLNSYTTDPTIYSGARITQLIDDFGTTLVKHLSDEIPTLMSLASNGSKLPLLDMVNRESKKSPLHVSITGGTPFFFRNLDVEFEGGLWKDWPPMPVGIWWVMQRTFVSWNSRWWRFASCDQNGRLRALPAVAESLTENEA